MQDQEVATPSSTKNLPHPLKTKNDHKDVKNRGHYLGLKLK